MDYKPKTLHNYSLSTVCRCDGWSSPVGQNISNIMTNFLRRLYHLGKFIRKLIPVKYKHTTLMQRISRISSNPPITHLWTKFVRFCVWAIYHFQRRKSAYNLIVKSVLLVFIHRYNLSNFFPRGFIFRDTF